MQTSKYLSLWTWMCLFVCLFVWGFTSHSRTFTYLETSQLPMKGCKFWPIYLALMAIEQWGFFNGPHQLWHGPTLYNISEDPWHSQLLPSVGSGAATTCFEDLGLSRPEILPRFPACETASLPLRHRGGPECVHLWHNMWIAWCK